jgi:hypothetical protein
MILLDVAERYADGTVGVEEYQAAKRAVRRMTQHDKRVHGENAPPFGQALLDFLRLKHLPGWEGDAPSVDSPYYTGDEARRHREAMRSRGLEVMTEEQAIEAQREYDAFMKEHTSFLRDIFGNPFRSFPFDPTWLLWNDSVVVRIAQDIYDQRGFDRLPILADALEEAGCHDPDILAHCRQPGEHARGCWVVDLLLGKE